MDYLITVYFYDVHSREPASYTLHADTKGAALDLIEWEASMTGTNRVECVALGINMRGIAA